MSISRRQLYAAGEPFGDGATRLKPGGRVYGGGGSGGGSSTSTGVTYTSNIPEYAQQPFMNLVGKSEALSNQPYQPFTGQRIQGFDPLQNQSFTQAQGLAGASFTNPSMSSNFMSPYMQNVVDTQKREAIRDAGIATAQRNAQAVKAGAFGGSRQAIMDAEANRNLMTNLSDIQGRGLQSAYESGRNQFNTEFGQQMDTTQMLNQLGGQRQQLGQRQLDQQYADFQAQRDYPYQQLGFLSDILRGVSGSTRTMYSSQPQASGLQQLAGLGTAAAGFGKMFKEGGEVKGYAAGGIAQAAQLSDQLGQMSDQALQQYTQMHKEDPYTVALATSEARRRQRLRAAAANAETVEPKQGTVVDREIAGMSEPIDMGVAQAVGEDEFEMAEGGLVGYADGGSLEEQRQRDREGIARFGRAAWEQMKRAGAAIADVGTLPVRGLAGAYDTAVVRPMRAAGLDAGYISPYLVPEGADVDSMTPFYDQFRRQESAPPAYYGNEGRRTPAPPMAQGIAQAAPMPEPSIEDTPPSRMPTVGGASSVRTTATSGGLGAYAGDPGDFGLGAAEKQARADLEALGKKRTEAAQAELDEFEKEAAARTPVGAAQEARIKEQQAGLGKKEEQAKGAALLQAGLAILSADPSRGALAAIGSGAMQGLSAYKGDMKDLEATREKMLDKLDAIDELRRQESVATGAEKRRLRGAIRTAELAGAQEVAQLSQKMGIEVRPKQRMEVWKEMQANWRTNRQVEGTVRAASIRVNDGPEDKRIKNAEAAFARDPEVQMLLEQAKGPAAMLDPTASQRITQRLRQIQESKYQQYGVKMVSPPAAGAPRMDLSGWGKPTVVSP